MTEQQGLPAPTFVTVNGVKIATYVLDDAPEPAADVVLCHGTPWSAEVWRELAGALSAHCRVFLWDMPGYGRSQQAADVAVDLPTQSRRLRSLLAHWGLERPHLVAHDIGGAVALGAHLDGADFASAFLWDIVTLHPWGSDFFRLVADHEDVFAALPERIHRAVVREYIAGAFASDPQPPWPAILEEPWTGERGRAAFYRQIAQVQPRDTTAIAAGLGGVRCPTRVGWGVCDPWIPVDQAQQLADALPGDTAVVLLPDAGHLVQVEDGPAVRDAVITWLAERGAWPSA
jgi:pimeloyl-ACP methyl ester carboxylesterase